MKTTKYFILLGLSFLIFSFTSCSSKKEQSVESSNTTEATAENVQYTCPMHPEVISDKPGKCPKCKMELVKVENSEMDTTNHEGHTH